jgi:hypothetical protein
VPSAVYGGNDADGSPMYVGRTYHEGDQLPAKVIPSKQAAYVGHNGQEIFKHHFEVSIMLFCLANLGNFLNFKPTGFVWCWLFMDWQWQRTCTTRCCNVWKFKFW